jgi:2-oxoglutarate ferredoxin oxidoreductase subunit beta
VPYYDLDEVDLAAGEAKEVGLPDGSRLTLRAIREDFDPTDRFAANKAIHEARGRGELLTGILHIETGGKTLHDYMHLVDTPLVALPSSTVKPGPEALAACMRELM